MSATATITFRTAPELKADVEEILEDIGMKHHVFQCFYRDSGELVLTLTGIGTHSDLF